MWGDDIKLCRRERLLEVENTFQKMVGMVTVMKVMMVSSQAAALEEADALESAEKSI